MFATRRRGRVAAGLAATLLMTACSATAGGEVSRGNVRVPTTPRPHSAPPSPSTRHASAATRRPVSTRPPTPTRHPPLPPPAGQRILGHIRVVAFYGGPDGPALGVLGSEPPDEIADQIERRAAEFAGYGLPVQPAMELITTVAQRGPGPDGLYSSSIGPDQVASYLAAAHRHKLLLILDMQPGRGAFLPQVEQFADVLRDPSVQVALDPEWKVESDQVPGTVIGSASAADVNAVRDYLANLVARDHLPDKLLLVHQFTSQMLPDRAAIVPRPGVEIVFHADGFGSQQAKLDTWRQLAFPGRPYGTGFKLFLRQDIDMMTPAQVMALRPRPDVVTFE